MSKLKIEIPNPCSKDWNSMVPSGNGRFCGSCDRVVVDFSVMTNAEIRAYFIQHKNEKICGNIVNKRPPLLQRVFYKCYSISHSKIRMSSFRSTLLIFLGLIMFLVGCKKKVIEHHTLGIMIDPTVNGKEQKITAKSQMSTSFHSRTGGWIPPIIIWPKEADSSKTDSL